MVAQLKAEMKQDETRGEEFSVEKVRSLWVTKRKGLIDA